MLGSWVGLAARLKLLPQALLPLLVELLEEVAEVFLRKVLGLLEEEVVVLKGLLGQPPRFGRLGVLARLGVLLLVLDLVALLLLLLLGLLLDLLFVFLLEVVLLGLLVLWLLLGRLVRNQGKVPAGGGLLEDALQLGSGLLQNTHGWSLGA